MRVLVVYHQGSEAADPAHAIGGFIDGDVEMLVDRDDGLTTDGWRLSADEEDARWRPLPKAMSGIEGYDIVIVGCAATEACIGGPVRLFIADCACVARSIAFFCVGQGGNAAHGLDRIKRLTRKRARSTLELDRRDFESDRWVEKSRAFALSISHTLRDEADGRPSGILRVQRALGSSAPARALLIA